jgi:hypothetical protein
MTMTTATATKKKKKTNRIRRCSRARRRTRNSNDSNITASLLCTPIFTFLLVSNHLPKWAKTPPNGRCHAPDFSFKNAKLRLNIIIIDILRAAGEDFLLLGRTFTKKKKKNLTRPTWVVTPSGHFEHLALWTLWRHLNKMAQSALARPLWKRCRG